MSKVFSDLKTPEELREYLSSPFSHVRKSVFHYTSLDVLVKIILGKRFKMSRFETSNDVIECDFVKPEIKAKRYICFMGTMIENFGMWAMYGGLHKQKKAKLANIYVKIEVPWKELKRLCDENGLSANKIAYTNIVEAGNARKTGIYYCGEQKNTKKIPLKREILSGFVKDFAWKYERELRVWTNKDEEYLNLDQRFIDSLKVIPSPLYSVKECEQLIKKTNPELLGRIKFQKNLYEGKYKGSK